MGVARKVLTVSANLIDLNHVGLQLDWIARRLYWIQVREEGREGGRSHYWRFHYCVIVFILHAPPLSPPTSSQSSRRKIVSVSTVNIDSSSEIVPFHDTDSDIIDLAIDSNNG